MAELGPGQVPASGEFRRERCAGASRNTVIDLELAVPGSEAPSNPWRGELEQPADVFRNHEVPRRPHDVRAQDGSSVEKAVERRIGGRAAPLSNSPLGARKVLRLHRPQPPHHVERRRERLADQALCSEAAGGEGGHNSGILKVGLDCRAAPAAKQTSRIGLRSSSTSAQTFADGGPRGGGGGFLNSSQVDSQLKALLQANASGYEWVAATIDANSAAS